MKADKSPQNLEYLQTTLAQQQVHTPPPAVRSRVLAVVSTDRKPQTALRLQPAAVRFGLGAAMTMAILIVLWFIVQPGIVLQWAWQNGDVETFQVYRAAEGSSEFTLVREISTQEALTQYQFVDPLLSPGQTYVYRIEGVNAQGQPAFSQHITDSALAALPGQLGILIASLTLAYGLMAGFKLLNIIPGETGDTGHLFNKTAAI